MPTEQQQRNLEQYYEKICEFVPAAVDEFLSYRVEELREALDRANSDETTKVLEEFEEVSNEDINEIAWRVAEDAGVCDYDDEAAEEEFGMDWESLMYKMLEWLTNGAVFCCDLDILGRYSAAGTDASSWE